MIDAKINYLALCFQQLRCDDDTDLHEFINLEPNENCCIGPIIKFVTNITNAVQRNANVAAFTMTQIQTQH